MHRWEGGSVPRSSPGFTGQARRPGRKLRCEPARCIASEQSLADNAPARAGEAKNSGMVFGIIVCSLEKHTTHRWAGTTKLRQGATTIPTRAFNSSSFFLSRSFLSDSAAPRGTQFSASVIFRAWQNGTRRCRGDSLRSFLRLSLLRHCRHRIAETRCVFVPG